MPIFCTQPPEMLRKQFPESIVYHHTDDILLANVNVDALERKFEEEKFALLEITNCSWKKKQRGDSINYLGY